MFFHAENQQILWLAIQKSPYLLEFSQKYAGHKETWFQGISEQFYSQWISQNGPVPANAKELLEMNKRALEYFVLDLKRLLGYHESVSDPLSSYNVAKEKQTREETNASKFNHYQAEYGRLLQRPAVPQNGLQSESAANQKIKNMDELLAEQAKLREMDLAAFSSKPTVSETKPNEQPNKPASHSGLFADPLRRQIDSVNNGNPLPPRLKIFDEIKRIDEIISLEIAELPQPKSVSWSQEIEDGI